jgi:hypothetical protein
MAQKPVPSPAGRRTETEEMFRRITETHGELSMLGAVAATLVIAALVKPSWLAAALVTGSALASITVYVIGSVNNNRNKKQRQQKRGGRGDSHRDAICPRCPRCGFALQPDRCARPPPATSP